MNLGDTSGLGGHEGTSVTPITITDDLKVIEAIIENELWINQYFTFMDRLIGSN